MKIIIAEILINLIQGYSRSKIRKRAEYGKLKLNGLHRDHPPV